MGILGVTLHFRTCVVQSRAAAMIVSELRQLSGCFPKSSTIHGRPECAAREKLSSICLLGKLYRYRRGPKQASGRLRQRGNAHDRQKLGPAGHVGRRGPTVKMTCDMRLLSFDAKETPWPVSLTNPPSAVSGLNTKPPFLLSTSSVQLYILSLCPALRPSRLMGDGVGTDAWGAGGYLGTWLRPGAIPLGPGAAVIFLKMAWPQRSRKPERSLAG